MSSTACSERASATRILAWNIRAGGGKRCHDIAQQIASWRADVVMLAEFRATPPSRTIASTLADEGLSFQRTTANDGDAARNALLVASRWPLRRIAIKRGPIERYRWLGVNVAAPRPFAVLGVHVPNRSSGRKTPFLSAVSDVVAHWRGHPAIVIGDTNSGRIGVDEESSAFDRVEDGWMLEMNSLGWRDAFRALYADRREFTWYSPNGNNGFRLDQAFIDPRLLQGLTGVEHRWGGRGRRRDALSDHAALLLTLNMGGRVA